MTAASPPALIHIAQDEVLTGEAVALDVQPIGFFLRALGCLIDVVISIAVLLLFVFVVGYLIGRGLVPVETFGIISIVVIVLVWVVLPTAVETITRGRSIGKLVVGGRIVRLDGGATGIRHAFIRAVVGVLEIWFTVGAIAALVGIFTPRSQRLGDVLAGTYSERTRTPKLPVAAPGIPYELAAWASVADVARLPDRLARRCAQFVYQAPNMEPATRVRLAASLAAELSRSVAPVPAVDADTLVRGVVAVRRERELRALQLENGRVDRLTAAATGAPRGFPER